MYTVSWKLWGYRDQISYYLLLYILLISISFYMAHSLDHRNPPYTCFKASSSVHMANMTLFHPRDEYYRWVIGVHVCWKRFGLLAVIIVSDDTLALISCLALLYRLLNWILFAVWRILDVCPVLCIKKRSVTLITIVNFIS